MCSLAHAPCFVVLGSYVVLGSRSREQSGSGRLALTDLYAGVHATLTRACGGRDAIALYRRYYRAYAPAFAEACAAASKATAFVCVEPATPGTRFCSPNATSFTAPGATCKVAASGFGSMAACEAACKMVCKRE